MLVRSFLLFVCLFAAVQAKNLKIAAGAGYKKVVLKVIEAYEKKGPSIDGFFGNMRQVSAQAKQSDIALIIGDKNFLLNKSGLDIIKQYKVGEGRVVIVYPKDAQAITNTQSLLDENIEKIAMPQPKKAIYGIAGEAFLKNEKIYEQVKEKLYIVATVPQVMTYVIANEVDAGIVNLTSALENRDKIGGYIEVNPKSHLPIEIIAAELDSCDEQCQSFAAFLQQDEAQAIFKSFGL
ncbi:molybdate ABC transporter substrate-binding protein [Candidatus Marinarcus aquaticus]|uniref:Molybdate ABC transporter substrate-binding protein n=1 Tax=Candidatus Marinarcus aquaticus TaxID=2044504 RepID=A0A4Q0XSK5_9BACT|nr:molybdate ABC transporter substrate-binding protein [Candidatus Marinarcus aquaticus]RXJ58097.1 molybdate ABC transporter substrate-binding protein [Candidatus Marinarcus aquaticus]